MNDDRIENKQGARVVSISGVRRRMRSTVPPGDRGPCTWCGRTAARFLYWYTVDGLPEASSLNGHLHCGVNCFLASYIHTRPCL